MSNYKSFFYRQLGLKEGSSFKPAPIQPSDVDPKELEMGVEDEKAHTDDPALKQKIALQHLAKHGDYYSRMKGAGLDENAPEFQKMVNPTAIATPVIAMAVRGSSTGGLPSGADRNMSAPNVDGVDVSRMTKGQLGGYEPVPTAKDNSELIDKTPVNQQINSTSPKTDSPQTQIDPHPFQTQKSQGEAPQNVTGASDDSDSTLKLKMAMPKGVDVDVAEQNQTEEEEDEVKSSDGGGNPNKETGMGTGAASMNETFARHKDLLKKKLDEGKHKAGCECGFCKNKGKMGKKKENEQEEPSKDEKTGEKNLIVGQEEDAKKTEECKDCGCDKANTTHDKKTKPLNETWDSYLDLCKQQGKTPMSYHDYWEKHGKSDSENRKGSRAPYVPEPKGSQDKKKPLNEAFERMRGLANLGERRVMANGLWASAPVIQENVGERTPNDEMQLRQLIDGLGRNEYLAFFDPRTFEAIAITRLGDEVWNVTRVDANDNEIVNKNLNRQSQLDAVLNLILQGAQKYSLYHRNVQHQQGVSENVGASEPFVTRWKMDKEKAGYVKKG